MQTVDEIMTPGCPNCYIKHMSAAIASLAINRFSEAAVPFHEVTAARALLNLTEYKEGYDSHWNLAIGLLAHAEVICDDDTERVFYRRIRTGLMVGEPGMYQELLSHTSGQALFAANLKEAQRELPDGPVPLVNLCSDTCVVYPVLGQKAVDEILSAIDVVENEYFSSPAVGEELKKEGGQDMACAKKAKCAAAKGGEAKAAQAACKGGKSACKPKKSCKK